jgi:hypothetical protein
MVLYVIVIFVQNKCGPIKKNIALAATKRNSLYQSKTSKERLFTVSVTPTT